MNTLAYSLIRPLPYFPFLVTNPISSPNIDFVICSTVICMQIYLPYIPCPRVISLFTMIEPTAEPH